LSHRWRRRLALCNRGRARSGGSVFGRKRTWSGKRRRLRSTRRGELCSIRRCCACMLYLCRQRRCSRIARHRSLLRRGSCIDSPAPAVETGARAMLLLHRIVVNIVHDGCVHVGHGLVVHNAVVVPIRAVVTAARVSETVVDAAVEAYVLAPITGVPYVDSGIKAPPWRRPQRAHPWGKHPHTRHPVISGVCIVPVSWCPHIVFTGAGRLRIIGNRRRGFLGFDGLLV
jgi:hypothetical protein